MQKSLGCFQSLTQFHQFAVQEWYSTSLTASTRRGRANQNEEWTIRKHPLWPMTVKVSQSCLTLCDPMDYTVLYSPWNSPGQNTGSGQLFPSPGDLPNPGIEPKSPALQASGFFTSWATRETHKWSLILALSLQSKYKEWKIWLACCTVQQNNTKWRKTKCQQKANVC